jgi:hypothetical protein
MSAHDTKTYHDHDEIWLLLPWYVNGSLDAAEHERVKTHARVCLLCRREIADQSLLAKRLQHEPRVEISAKPSFDRLMARIQSEQAAPQAPKPMARPAAKPQASPWSDWFNGLLLGWNTPRFAAVGASLLLLLAAPYLARQQATAPAFRTVADQGSMDKFGPNDVRVIFAEQLGKADIGQLVTALNGRIIDGPSPAGLYTIHLDGGADNVGNALARLRRNALVLFAEPALPPSQASSGEQQ